MALNENYILEDSDALGSFGFITYTVSLKGKRPLNTPYEFIL